MFIGCKELPALWIVSKWHTRFRHGNMCACKSACFIIIGSSNCMKRIKTPRAFSENSDLQQFHGHEGKVLGLVFALTELSHYSRSNYDKLIVYSWVIFAGSIEFPLIRCCMDFSSRQNRVRICWESNWWRCVTNCFTTNTTNWHTFIKWESDRPQK